MLSGKVVSQPGRPAASVDDRGRSVAGLMVDARQVSASQMVEALGEAVATGAPLRHVLLAQDLVDESEYVSTLARRYGVMALNREEHPPDRGLDRILSAEICITHGVLPWMWIGATLVVAATARQGFEAVRGGLEAAGYAVVMAVASETDIHAEIGQRHGQQLIAEAETSVPDAEACRDLGHAGAARVAVASALAIGSVGLLALAPVSFFAALLALSVVTLIATQTLKFAALIASRKPVPLPGPPTHPLPHVTILVPLFREAAIAGALVERLRRLSYPKSCLSVLLVLEDIDAETARLLAAAELPGWVRTIVVPGGTIRTKPRALNYALRFSKGSVIGILDAEDAPAVDQIERVVARFQTAPPEVACLQGILDFYNPRANWLSRCFAIEYATWFRLVLPGLARLGVPIPLGGTTVYFRREALEAVRGWDAHNVTEDADLGLRLARHGFRTEIVQTVTREEANNRLWPWIKQRARWLKGYAMTWATHSRDPAALVRDLGPWRAGAVQVLFLGTLLQFLLAPVLWSFWLLLAGAPHPVAGLLLPEALAGLFAIFIAGEAVTVLAGLIAVARSPHPHLMAWVPGLILYFPLGTIAMYRAAWELVTRPFHWDKTQHGHSAPDRPDADRVPD
ncbi:Glycosyltransferase, catalytic subunit of cellulose synthase and poly-beta-1,6-N-acetylglucosamine synthase [Roseivivax lentus]|uniref:Glycosyltransferase, catalytic subunit of cellulose synthase and poly-beta-1,6-N-acetylglucosamine synthase n=1 Tax=Roseivivax lentus TaxID=633194 RepID=A0A1N7LDE5_9RHOB|nr:glycosyltransferase [Roseivivax lentus]SIS71844.1 Glycosyltransferase, catalytic subunit of cellulose synthase and poly-beta-1,6-N-acetylglucosamine synthase [Roseivivax lentus]